MIVSIAQPAYLGWLGYFHRLWISDLHIVLDHVEIGRRSFTNRNKIRTAQGWTWLTVPVNTKGEERFKPISRLEITDPSWQRKHWQSIRLNYGKAPFFENHASFLEDLYARQWTSLEAVINEANDYLMSAMGLQTPLRYSAEMNPSQTKDDLILELCQEVGATTYISGPFGRDYLDEKKFINAGIRVVYHDYVHPEYKQMFFGFEPFMSVLDVLFMYGSEAMNIIRKDQPVLL